MNSGVLNWTESDDWGDVPATQVAIDAYQVRYGRYERALGIAL